MPQFRSRRLALLFALLIPCGGALSSCASPEHSSEVRLRGDRQQEARVEAILDALHRAASEADEETYFSLFTDDAIFLGTDATERWTIEEFRTFALPYFERESAWTYTPRERNVTVFPSPGAKRNDIAMFDEILDQKKYGTCRGSGLLRQIDGKWRIAQYHLTIPIPNEITSPITAWIRDQEIGTRWVFCVRHAEKGKEGRDPPLTAAGRARAERLALILGALPVTACFASEYQRTQQTVAPIAARQGFEVTSVPARDLSALLAALDALPADSIAVVAGHSNTVPALIERLGITDEISIAEGSYGELFAIRRAPSGVELLRLSF